MICPHAGLFCCDPRGPGRTRRSGGYVQPREDVDMERTITDLSQEAKLHRLLALHTGSHGFGVWEWNIPERLVLFSPGLPGGCHSSPDDSLSIPVDLLLKSVNREDYDRLLEAGQAVSQDGATQLDVAYRLERPNKGWVWLLLRGRLTESVHGRPLRMAGISIDISRLRADPAFQQNAGGVGDTPYHAMLENSPDLIVRLDRELFPLYINPEVSRYMTRSRDQLPGTDTIEDLRIEPEQFDFLQRNINRVYDEKISIREMVTFRTGYGHAVTGEYSFWPEFDVKGEVKSVMTQFRDQTEQIHMAEQARLNEMRLGGLYQLTQMENASEDEVVSFVLTSMRQLTNSANSFFFIPDGDIRGNGTLFWSGDGGQSSVHGEFPATILPYPPGEDGTRPYRVIRNGDGEHPIHSLFDDTVHIMRCIIAPCSEGEHIVCLAGVYNKSTDYDDAELQQVETFINGAWLILSRHRHLRELEKAKEAAEAANQAKAEFLANVNHELRTPLTSILGYAETMLNLRPEDEALRLRCISIIQRHAEQMHKLVEELLSLSHLESTATPLSMAVVHPATLAAKAAESLHALLEKKHITVRNTIPQHLTVPGDALFLEQVFRNLFENACRYAPPSSHLEVSAQQNEDTVVVSVRDQGTGIEPDDLERIFERFYRSRQNTPGHKSTGIGLSICKHVVERHGGVIWAENTMPGAAFHFTLPLIFLDGTNEART